MAAPMKQFMTERILRRRKCLTHIRRTLHTTLSADGFQLPEEDHFKETHNRNPFKERKSVSEKPIIPHRSFPSSVKADPVGMERVPKTDSGHQFKKHPGCMKSKKLIEIPKILENSLNVIFKDSGCNTLESDGLKLYNYLKARKLPESRTSLISKARQLESQVTSNLSKEQKTKIEELLAQPELTAEEEKELKNTEEDILHKIKMNLHKITYHYEPLPYDEDFALRYSYSRMIPNYCVLTTCLSEIKKRDPAFEPESVLNMGSGIGSAVWATHSLWPDTVRQYYCVDDAPEMNKMAMQILKEGNVNRLNMVIPNVYFRDKLPSQRSGQFSIVICAYTLMDFPHRKSRLQLISELWDRTKDYFVLVDVGTRCGFELIQEVRHRLLKISEQTDQVNIFAPCPNIPRCPMLNLSEKPVPCNFEVQCPQWKGQSQDRIAERYSYIIFKKGELASDATNNWPRIVFKDVIQKRPKDYAICTLCCPDGSLGRYDISKRRNGRELYRMACESQWGDLLPVKLEENDELHFNSDSEESTENNTGTKLS
uniref:Methyltransferase-like protein 17, mitochondrial isoform X1 n=2 Tax=Crassostrea virginica TaxID=6565 RepID=A0A8B8E9Z5_CRAVI|nr:methyltransferase-like protein 17, mitochondrial isoform X1 [Crassostrea virginica]